jgi:hypothetical protein
MFLYSYASFKSNQTQETSWFFFNWALMLIPLWAVVAKYSKHLLFDGMLYDVIMVFTFTIFTAVLSKESNNYSWYNYSGVVLILIGFMLMKMRS